MTVPEVDSSTSRAPAVSEPVPGATATSPASRTVAVEPRASAIWLATVRCQIIS